MLFTKILMIFIVLSQNTLAQIPKLSTKQDINNLRFIGQDGSHTYYQRRSGTLLFATNFKVHEVIQNAVGTHYSIVSTRSKKYLAVSADESFFTSFNLKKPHKIYLIEYGTSKSTFVGLGNNPQLHLNDTWISFIKKYKREINFINIKNPVLKFNIQLAEKKNFYFTPTSFMLDIHRILYIDQNDQGFYRLIQFNKATKQSQVIYKLQNPFKKIEVCIGQKKIFIGVFDLDYIHRNKTGSKIFSSPKEEIKLSEIYSSKLSDIGNLLCDFDNEKIYFIKMKKMGQSELVEFNPSLPEKKRIKFLSNLKKVSQAILMDGKLLIPLDGHFYVPLGESDYRNKDNLSKSKEIEKTVL